MLPLYTKEQFKNTKSIEKLPCQCYNCKSKFYVIKSHIKYELKNNRGRIKFCSQKCNNIYNNSSLHKLVKCKNCQKTFYKKQNEIKKTNSHFCSRSCSTTYHNKYNKTGTTRSKLEKWIEKHLPNQFPNLTFKFNDCNTIGSELDIYIPELNLAFELNGVVHYEPIFGNDKLQQIQENDKNKFKACHDNHIDLCSIDTSNMKYFKEKHAQKYLDIITNIVKEHLKI